MNPYRLKKEHNTHHLLRGLVTLSVLLGIAWSPADTAEASTRAAAAAPCDKLTASTPISWYATDADGNVDTSQTVESYPTGTLVIAPGFQYPCAPSDTDIVIIVYNQAYGTDPALIDKNTLKASSTPDTFFYAITTPDGTPLQEGDWRTAFYEDKTPLTTGDILVGGTNSLDPATQVVLEGTVEDQRTGQPIWQARVYVLNPGVTVDQFRNDPARDDIFVQTRTDSDGSFSIWKPLSRNVAYAMLIVADGYKLKGADHVLITDQATNPVSLDIKMVKR